MMAPDSRLFSVDAAPRDGGGLTLALSGELDLSTIERLEQTVASRVDGKAELVVMDLRELAFFDSTGLRLMLRLHARLEETGGRLVLIRGSRRVHRVFELTGAVDELEIVLDPAQIDAQPNVSAGSG